MKRHALGSTTGKATGCCSAIETSGTATLRRVRRILVPVDFSTDSARALHCAILLGGQFGASINAVYGLASAADLKAEAADLIIISTRGRNGQGAVEQVLRSAPCPVLVVRRNRALLRSKGDNESANPPQSRGVHSPTCAPRRRVG
jgi:hypothetical protein